jgi:hypothetical protein
MMGRWRRDAAPLDASGRLGLFIALGAVLIATPFARIMSGPRVDFFYLADAILHERTWLAPAPWLGPQDIVLSGTHVFVPFGPFPALALIPLVAALGVGAAAALQPEVNVLLFGASAYLAWVLAARFDEGHARARVWAVSLLLFSSPLLSMAAYGGVWYTSQLFAVVLSLLLLLEATGARRPVLLGLLVGAMFLTRAPLILAMPLAIAVAGFGHGLPTDRATWNNALVQAGVVLLATVPAGILFLGYNEVRFGSPLQTGYGLATLTVPFLEVARSQGLISLKHLLPNLALLLVRPPAIGPPRWLATDGIGLTILFTSPGLLFAWRAQWSDTIVRAAALTGLLILIPNLLYYGGGYSQIGFRYLLDSWPFLFVAVASATRRGMKNGWKAFIAFGIAVNAWLVVQLFLTMATGSA